MAFSGADLPAQVTVCKQLSGKTSGKCSGVAGVAAIFGHLGNLCRQARYLLRCHKHRAASQVRKMERAPKFHADSQRNRRLLSEPPKQGQPRLIFPPHQGRMVIDLVYWAEWMFTQPLMTRSETERMKVCAQLIEEGSLATHACHSGNGGNG